MNNEPKWNGFFNKKIGRQWINAFVISSAVFASYFILKNFDSIISYGIRAIQKLLKILTPLIIGVILAYLFNRPVMFFEKFFKKAKYKREISIALFYIIIIGIISLVINFVVPGIQKNLIQLTNIDLPGYSSVISSYYQKVMDWMKSAGMDVDYNSIQSSTSIQNYISKFTTISSVMLDYIIRFVRNLTQGILNVFLAMVLAYYLLEYKERILGFIKEVFLLYSKESVRDPIINEMREFNVMMSSYISGALIDALIVCVLMTLGLRIIGHKYFLLMGVTIGLLNLIPYFGSLIGGIVACILALFQGIPKALITLITIVIIQQVDGNIIQPKIVGAKVGLEPLWVIVSVLVFGGYWGIVGMLIAIPATVVIKTILIKLINKKKRKAKT